MKQMLSERKMQIALLAGFLTCAVLVGCHKKSTESTANNSNLPGPGAGQAPVASGPFAAGKQTFDMHCAKCHSINGQGGPPMGGPPGGPGGPGGGPPMGGPPGGPGGRMKGPDLGKVAADAKHTRDWIGEHVKDPQSHKPESRMPKFASKFKDDEFSALLDYLTSLKG